jgi:dTDP-glucose 4,6-dehydratase
MIGSGANSYQMVGVDDCARAAILAVEASCPPGPFNLGSRQPPSTRELLQRIINHARSRSILLPLPVSLAKPILAGLDALRLTVLHPEQYGIADINIQLDASSTFEQLGWVPQQDDTEMMIAAYQRFVAI